MPTSSNHDRVFRFGLHELDGETGELRKDGKSRPRLQGQPLEVLLALLDRAGELVTREELRLRLWPSDTFVDYDHSLNTAVNKLREALSDSAENPRFIQTIPRRGYRFIATVEAADGIGNLRSQIENPTAAISPTQAPVQSPVKTHTGKRPTLLSDAEDLPSASRGIVRTLFSLIQVMYLSFYIASLVRVHETQIIIEQILHYPKWLFLILIVSALVGIPVRLYLLSAVAFGYRRLTRRFLSLFPGLFPLDELWALSPLLLVEQIGVGLALAATAALLYVPFAQRSLLLMGESDPRPD